MTTTQKEFTAKPEISALPKPIQEKLTDFIYKEIPKVRFFKPDGKPKAEWKIFYGDSLGVAWDAAWDAARNAARVAARVAARDATLCSYYILTSDLKFKDKEKHLRHVKERWEVWEKGYGLLCDVDGQLYVYSIERGMKP